MMVQLDLRTNQFFGLPNTSRARFCAQATIILPLLLLQWTARQFTVVYKGPGNDMITKK